MGFIDRQRHAEIRKRHFRGTSSDSASEPHPVNLRLSDRETPYRQGSDLDVAYRSFRLQVMESSTPASLPAPTVTPAPGQPGPFTLAVDIGGSGVKLLRLDAAGQPVGERARQKTPVPATPDAILDAIATLATQQSQFDRVSVGFPGVVRSGVIHTAVNLHDSWHNYDLAQALSQRLGKPVRVANDADIQGLGAISGQGVELVLTLGTGMGSALFVEGRLVPNLEMAHHVFRKDATYEEQLGRAALESIGTKRWNRRLQKAIEALAHLFNYDRLYLGGGETRKITLDLPDNVQIVPNILGLLGGIALWRDEKTSFVMAANADDLPIQ
jgi:polyphosphate glucokinase